MFSDDDIIQLRKSYIEIGKLVQQYGCGQYNGILKIVMGQINCIDSDASEDEKNQYLVESYNRIFGNPKGLGDFVIYDKNREMTKQLNEKFCKAMNDIWNIIKPYI